MKAALPFLAALVLGACAEAGDTAETFSADRNAAEAVVAECDAGRRTRGCNAAREGLAEAKRRDRQALYRQPL